MLRQDAAGGLSRSILAHFAADARRQTGGGAR
jgi:hypothetical protein